MSGSLSYILGSISYIQSLNFTLLSMFPGMERAGTRQSDNPGNIPDQVEESGASRASGAAHRDRSAHLQDQQENTF